MHSTSYQKKPLAGFTLIELLVVISVIAILALMLMGAIEQVRRAAKGSVCLSNLHQIALGSQAYSSDNEGGQVPNYGTNPDGTNAPSYFDFLYPYIEMNSRTSNKQKKNVFVCPGGRAMKTSAEGGWDWMWNYGLNEALHPNFDVGSGWKTIHSQQVSNPSEVADIADGTQDPTDVSGNSSRVFNIWNNWQSNNTFYDDDSGWKAAMLGDTPDTSGGVLRYRHGGKGFAGQVCNISWFDGHAAGVKHLVLTKSKNFAAELR